MSEINMEGSFMAEEQAKATIVIGHINPDTDSICSAICYARLKEKLTGKKYEARRAGQLNDETKYVLKKFGADKPHLQENVSPQVSDAPYRRIEGVSSDISMKKAWEIMKANKVVTLPIVKDRQLEGLITIENIATSYMDVYDSRFVSEANTRYKNIVETLEGTMPVGDESEYFSEGKVLIAAANPEIMENYIEPGDLVILGNRYESQLSAIEMKAGCIVICEGAAVTVSISKLAAENNCKVILTPYDAYTVARLINQSVPVIFFKFSEKVITFNESDYVEDIRNTMSKHRRRDFPVLDKDGNYLGMLSRRNLLDVEKKKVILVDHNEKNQAVRGIDDADILEIIDHHRIGTLETISPVYFRNQPLGCTATIIYQMYCENGITPDAQTAGLLCAAILSDTLMYRSPTCTELDKQTAETLAELAGIKTEEFASEMFHAADNLLEKSEKDLFYQDFKKYVGGDVSFGVGQVTSLNGEDLDKLKDKMAEYLKTSIASSGLEMMFFMLTDIKSQVTTLVFAGEQAGEIVENAFGFEIAPECSYVRLKNVVSRKKQLLPAIMEAMQQ